MYIEPLEIFNSYEKACQYKLGFNSTLSKRLGYSDIGDNKAEGIVIRNMNSASALSNNRFIIKKKLLNLMKEMLFTQIIKLVQMKKN